CLRNAISARLTSVWLEMVPRLVYPLVLVFFIYGILTFWMVYILPRMMRIFQDFGAELPDLTASLIDIVNWVEQYDWEMLLALSGLAALIALLFISSAFRWYCPGVGRLTRMHAQSRVLKMLAALFQAGKTAPQALGLLANSEYSTFMMRRRLN